MSNDKKSKLQRKIKKRIYKSHETLQKHEGIQPSTEKTNKLFVANGGLSNGVTREEIYECFEKFGTISHIIMHPHKSYCFVVFEKIESAVEACETSFAKLSLLSHLENIEKFLFLSYVNQVPTKSSKEDNRHPKGLLILQDFLESKEIEELSNIVNNNPCESDLMKNRRVSHYGYEFDYSCNGVYPDNQNVQEIPHICFKILQRLFNNNTIPYMPDQLTINTYMPGHGIPAHIDNPEAFEDHIVVFSIGSQINMDFKHKIEDDMVTIVVPKDSVMIMSEDSRYGWTHSIVARGVDLVQNNDGEITLVKRQIRSSFTFRKIRKDWLEQKNRSEGNNSAQMVEKFSMLLEREHVQKVYNTIGDHFSSTRHSPWPKVSAFINSLPYGSVLLDVGCGNGKYLKLRKDEVIWMGCDNSINLCSICARNGHHILACDLTQLPYKEDSFDALICIAVMHHLASKERRIKALKEMCRVLKKSGRALVYVWAMEQKHKNEKSNYLKDSSKENSTFDQVSQNLSHLRDFKKINSELSVPVHVNRTAFKQQDTLVPWHLTGSFKANTEDNVLHRYYHLFKQGEVVELFQQLPGLQITQEYYDQGNWAYEFGRS